MSLGAGDDMLDVRLGLPREPTSADARCASCFRNTSSSNSCRSDDAPSSRGTGSSARLTCDPTGGRATWPRPTPTSRRRRPTFIGLYLDRPRDTDGVLLPSTKRPPFRRSTAGTECCHRRRVASSGTDSSTSGTARSRGGGYNLRPRPENPRDHRRLVGPQDEDRGGVSRRTSNVSCISHRRIRRGCIRSSCGFRRCRAMCCRRACSPPPWI